MSDDTSTLPLVIFGKSVEIDRDTAFSTDYHSPKTGLRLNLKTEAGSLGCMISIGGPKPKPKEPTVHPVKAIEHVLRISVNGKPWSLEGDPSFKGLFISIGGPKPKAELGDPTIELKSDFGNWHVHPDPTGDNLDVSFGDEHSGF